MANITLHKFSAGFRYAAVMAASLVMSCSDDLGHDGSLSDVLTIKVAAPEGWTSGKTVNREPHDSRCVSVDAATTEGNIPLYLHALECDNTDSVTTTTTRGAIKKSVEAFSLSGICYSATYSEDYKPDFAYDLTCSVSGGNVSCPQKLYFPTEGNVRFFAFAPVNEDGNTAPFSLSGETKKGTPQITYTVPNNAVKQHDLMAACTDATSREVELSFRHILTAVKIVAAPDMIPGTITKVTLSGVYNKGTYTPTPTEDKWTNTEVSKTVSNTYTLEYTDGISTEDNGYKPGDANSGKEDELVGNGDKSTEIVGETNDYTLLMIPQTLPEGAKLEVEFKEKLSGKEYTLTADLNGKEWPAGKIITYSISPSSMHLTPKVEFEKGADDILPYSGVWYDAKVSATIEVTKDGVEGTQTVYINDKLKGIQYQIAGEEGWTECKHDENGLLVIASQPAFEKMKTGFKTGESGTASSPIDLTTEYDGETANCYLIDQAGYYSLPLVYGNGNVKDDTSSNGLTYYPSYDDNTHIPAGGTISGAADAVLCWQDAPDLIDPASVKIADGKLQFHIRKNTLMQGNALLAVRNANKDIIWSWHIWVTPYKDDFYSNFYHSVTYNTETEANWTEANKLGEYDLAQYNLGWCDSHEHNNARTFNLQAIVDLSEYGGLEETVFNMGTFTQMEYKGSQAGDNTYFQWGRKDPMLGGIYNEKTPTYLVNEKTGEEFTMENKQVFNEYDDGAGHNYAFCKNPGDMLEPNFAVEMPNPVHPASNGASIGYTIQHPYMFVTNSRSEDTEINKIKPKFSYRNHWHVPYKDNQVPYLKANLSENESHIMFNAWNTSATEPGQKKGGTDYLEKNAAPVTKSVYDPCPPRFKIPPIDAFRGIAKVVAAYSSYCGLSGADIKKGTNAWTITYNYQSITFPLTGVRNNAVRSNIWNKVTIQGNSSVTGEELYKTSLPAFKKITYITGATIAKASGNKQKYGYQVLIFVIDNRYDNGGNPAMHSFNESSNSYGLSVRPMHYDRNQEVTRTVRHTVKRSGRNSAARR